MAEITVADAIKNNMRAIEKRTFQNGAMRIEVGLAVKGVHSYQSLDSEGLKPPMQDLLVFPFADTAQPVNVYAGSRGTISFFVKLVYQFFPSFGGGVLQTGKAIMGAGGPPISFGSRVYRYSFDYALPLAAANPTDLTIQPPPAVAVMVEDPVVEGDDDNTAEINVWNPDIGMAKGPNYVRIKPSVALPQTSGSSSGGLGKDGFGYQQTTSTTPPLPGNAIGEFTIPIHTQLLDPPAPVAASDPPAVFVKDMAVGWTYDKDLDRVLTPAMQNSLSKWMGNINAKYLQTIAKAVHKGELTVSVGGYASAVGSPADNQKLSTLRVDPVVDFISRYLAVPKNKILAVPYGSQFSKPYWEFDLKGSAKMVSRPEDRKVIVSIDPNDAWKVK